MTLKGPLLRAIAHSLSLRRWAPGVRTIELSWLQTVNPMSRTALLSRTWTTLVNEDSKWRRWPSGFFGDSAWDGRFQILSIAYAAAYASAKRLSQGQFAIAGIGLSTILILLWASLIVAIVLYAIPIRDAARLRRILLVAFGATFVAIANALSFADPAGFVAAIIWAAALGRLLWTCRDPDDDRQQLRRVSTFLALTMATIIAALQLIPTSLLRSLPPSFWTAGPVTVGSFTGIVAGLLIEPSVLYAFSPPSDTPDTDSVASQRTLILLALLALFFLVGMVLARPALHDRWQLTSRAAYIAAGTVSFSKTIILAGPLLWYLGAGRRSRSITKRRWRATLSMLCGIGLVAGLIEGIVLAYARQYLLVPGPRDLEIVVECLSGGLLGCSLAFALTITRYLLRSVPR